MTPVQRMPVIEEVILSDSDDEIHILDNGDSKAGKSNCETMNESVRAIFTKNKFQSQNIKFTIEQVYLQGDFDVFNVPDSSDEEAAKHSKVNLISNNTSRYDTFMDHQGRNEGAETDEDRYYIDESVQDSNTASDEPIDLSLGREDERLSSISSSLMSPSSKSDDDKLSTVSSGVDISKEIPPLTNIKTDEENVQNLNNVFQEDMETENATSDDELDSTQGVTQDISMPSRNDKQFRIRGKTHVETICVTCHIERRMAGKLWQNKTCRHCQENLQFQCAKCKKRFTSYHSTLCHLKKECMSQKFWNCPKCSYSVLEEKKLEDHIKRVHVNGVKRCRKKPDKTESYSCDRCNVGFRWKGNYEKHKCRRQEIYRCQMCDYTNNNKNVIKRHINNSHIKDCWSQPKMFAKFISTIDTRPICVPDITTSSTISNETKRKTEEETRAEEERLNKAITLHCPKCSRNFDYTGTHIKKCETCEGSLLWQCIPCNELSKSYCGIYAHLQNSCPAILKTCKKCSKRFHSSDDLEKHQHICGQDLYLQCELCDYKTRAKGFFLKHVKDKHKLQDDEIRKWL